MINMGIFENMLGSGESLFKDGVALDYDYVPRIMPHRENEQKYIANCIQPLLQGMNGRNLFISGTPGIGKTASVRWILRDLQDDTDDVIPIYIN